MIWPLSLLVGVLVVLIITAATAYFVAQEFAYMSVDRSRLKAAAATGDAGAARALAITRRTSFMLSGAQLGITVTGLLVGYVAEPLIGAALGGVSVPAAVGITIGTLVALTFSTFVQMLLGELFPKNLAIARPEPVATALARSTRLYLTVFGWLIAVFDASSNLLLRLLRIEPVHDVEHSATLRDLEHIVAASRDSGDLPRDLSILLDRVIDFPNRTVEHAMIPRARVGVLRPGDDLDRIRDRMCAGHSRYPVIDDADDGVGVVHLPDVLECTATGPATSDPGATGAPATAWELMRPPLFVPAVLGLPRALADLAGSGNQLACVLDEYGGFVGVLTIEDLAEELVGEIADEHDPAGPPVLAPEPAPGGWSLPGDLPIDEVQRLVGRTLPAGDYETLAGLAIARSGGFPPAGRTIEVPLPADAATLALDDAPPSAVLRLRVDDVRRHVPARFTVTLVDPAPGQPARPAGPGLVGES
ncbi:hemolysin family protein [Nakamurella sp.]|uniref:hemolysin family protein n=1 Tax=Nakamurella sp. TaxID=1869182 RepID=UPI003B3A536C